MFVRQLFCLVLVLSTGACMSSDSGSGAGAEGDSIGDPEAGAANIGDDRQDATSSLPPQSSGFMLGVSCEVTGSSAVSLDESTLGFSPADALALAEGSRSGTLTWADGSEAAYTMDVAAASDTAELIDYEAVSPQDGPVVEFECDDRYEIAVTLGLETDDSSLSLSLDLTLNADIAGSAGIFEQLSDEAAQPLVADLLAEYDTVTVLVDIAFSEGNMFGQITAQASNNSSGELDEVEIIDIVTL